MIKIEVFGGGCPKCKKVEKNSKEALKKLKLEGEIAEVKDQAQILKRGVTSTPAIAVNGSVKAMGRIPEVSEIVSWLQAT